jgi:hypothetical protein
MATLLRMFSIAACLVVAFGFLVFAFGEAGQGSREQIDRIDGAGGHPVAGAEEQRERSQGALAEAIDDANDILLAPFEGLTDSRNEWVQQLVPTALALLVYGFGVALLANALPPPRPR